MDTDTHLTELFADRAIDFMQRSEESGDPFFCMVAFNAVHNFTWQLPPEELERHGLPEHHDFDPFVEEYVDWYDRAISPNFPEGRAYYLAQLDLMDRHIGRMLDAVEESGSNENTVVVYLTDNGGSTCNYGDNGPLDGTKYTLYEGGVRVPYIVRWPGLGQPGTTSDALVSSLDLMPTFVAAAGERGGVPDYDGQDVREVLAGNSDGHQALFFDTGFQQALVTPEAKWRWLTEDSAPMREAILRVDHTDIGEGGSLVRFDGGLADELGATGQVEDEALLERMQGRFAAWQEEVRAGRGAG